jgi:hypothetical protein
MALGGSIALLLGAVTAYQQQRVTVLSGDVWVEPGAPANSVPLSFYRPSRELLVENTHGNGSFSVVLRSARDQAPVSEAAELAFSDRGLSFDRLALGVADLPTGEYLLSAELRSGSGGRIGYALVQQNSMAAATTAGMVGLGVGAVLATGTLLVSLRREKPPAE